MIDWSATGQMLAGIAAFGSVAAIVWAALVGKSAVSDYRQQKLVDKEIDAAHAALTAAYRAYDAIDQMRGRWIPAGEIQAAEKALAAAGVNLDEMDTSLKQANVNRGVIYRRAEFFKDDFDAIFEAIPTARVYFGQDVVDWLKSFPRARNTILNSADMLGMATGQTQEDRSFAIEIRRDVYGAPKGQPDSIGDMIASAIDGLEDNLLPKLRNDKVIKK